MKNRFYDNEGNFPEDLFPDFNEEEQYDEEGPPYDEEAEEEFIHEREEIFQALELERRDLNQKVLFRTIRTLEKSWLWYFYSSKTKSKMITQTYKKYQDMILKGQG